MNAGAPPKGPYQAERIPTAGGTYVILGDGSRPGSRLALASTFDGVGPSEETEKALADLLARAPELRDALRVLVFSSRSRAWLSDNDPQALAQAENALEGLV